MARKFKRKQDKSIFGTVAGIIIFLSAIGAVLFYFFANPETKAYAARVFNTGVTYALYTLGIIVIFALIVLGIIAWVTSRHGKKSNDEENQAENKTEKLEIANVADVKPAQQESKEGVEVPEPNQSTNDSKKNAWQHARDFFTKKPKVAFWTKGVVGAIAALLVIFLFANLFSGLGTDEREQIASKSKPDKIVVVTDTIHNANGQDTIHRHVTIVNDTARTEPSASKSAGSETEQVAEEKPAEEKSWWDKLTGGSSGKSEAEQIKDLEAKKRLAAKKEEKRQSKKVDSNGDNSDISVGNTSSNRPSQTRQTKRVPTYYKNAGNETWVDGPEAVEPESRTARPRTPDPGEQNYNQGGATLHMGFDPNGYPVMRMNAPPDDDSNQ